MKTCLGTISLPHESINYRKGKCPLCSVTMELLKVKAERDKLWQAVKERLNKQFN